METTTNVSLGMNVATLDKVLKTNKKLKRNFASKRKTIDGVNYGKLNLANGVTYISPMHATPRLYLITQGTVKWKVGDREMTKSTGDYVYIKARSEQESIEVVSEEGFTAYWSEKELPEAEKLLN